MGERLAVGVQSGGGVAGGLEEPHRLVAHRRQLGRPQAGLTGQDRRPAVVLGQQRHHLVRAVARPLLQEPAHLEVLARPDRLGEHLVGHVADQHVLERQLGLAPLALAGGLGDDDVLLLE